MKFRNYIIFGAFLAVLIAHAQDEKKQAEAGPTSIMELPKAPEPIPAPPSIEEPKTNAPEPVPALPAPPALEEPKTVAQIAEEPTINIGLAPDVLKKEAELLNKLLADEYILYTQTLKSHWNVQGIVFHDFHLAFKEQYEKLFEIVDLIAERIRALGHSSAGSLQEFKSLAQLKESNTQNLTPVQIVKQLLAGHEEIIRSIRQAIETTAKLGDQGTSNFLQDLIIKQEKIAWMLRATAS